MGSPNGRDAQAHEPRSGHILQKAILNDYWMDNGRSPNENFKNLDAQRMNEFVAKIYYCWVQMWREQNPEMFEDENEGLVE